MSRAWSRRAPWVTRKRYASQNPARSYNRCEDTMTAAPRSRLASSVAVSHAAASTSRASHGSSSTTRPSGWRPSTVRRPRSCRVPRESARMRRRSSVTRSPLPSLPQSCARAEPGNVASPAKYATPVRRNASRGSSPLMRTSPVRGCRIPTSARRRAVFPTPAAPTTPSDWPSASEKDTRSNTRRRPYRTVTSRAETTTGITAPSPAGSPRARPTEAPPPSPRRPAPAQVPPRAAGSRPGGAQRG